MTPQITKMEERLRDLVGGGWYKNGKRIPLPTDTSKIIYGETLKFIQSEITLTRQEEREKCCQEVRKMVRKFEDDYFNVGLAMDKNYFDQLNSQLTIKKEDGR